jgi:hypothetical protein
VPAAPVASGKPVAEAVRETMTEAVCETMTEATRKAVAKAVREPVVEMVEALHDDDRRREAEKPRGPAQPQSAQPQSG